MANPASFAAVKAVVIPLGGAVGNATPEDVVKGKTFSSKAAGKGVEGTLVLPPSMQSYTNSYGMTFNLIPAGTFTMGNPDAEPGEASADETQHQVTLTEPFYMQTTEVTQKQWRDVVLAAETKGYLAIGVLDEEPSYYHSSTYMAFYPVEAVSWEDIRDWINALNHLTRQSYALPTEAQWEYAARATTTTPWAYLYSYDASPAGEATASFNPNVSAMGWYEHNNTSDYATSGTKPVARKQPNKWGLYDMHGNVGEWCQDWYDDYPGDVTDPLGPAEPSIAYLANRVYRGGSFGEYAGNSRSADRGKYNPESRVNFLGFRLVLSPNQ